MTQANRILTFAAAALCAAFASIGPASAQSTEPLLGDLPLGRPDAPVTIVEYASFTCPHCAQFHLNTLPKLKQAYIDTGKVKLVFRDFPFDEPGLRAGMLARCAGPTRFYGFVEVLFRQQRNWATAADPTQALAQLAKLGGISEAEFKACMTNQKIEDAILNNRLNGQKDDVTSTPTFIINGEKHSGTLPFEEFEKLLQPLVPASATQPAPMPGSAQAQTAPQPSTDRPTAQPPAAAPPGAETSGSNALTRPGSADATSPQVPGEAAPQPAAGTSGGVSWWIILAAALIVVAVGGYWLRRRGRPR